MSRGDFDPQKETPMRFILFLFCLLAFGLGLLFLAFAAAEDSALIEIEAGIAFLISAVFLTGAAVCDAIASQNRRRG